MNRLTNDIAFWNCVFHHNPYILYVKIEYRIVTIQILNLYLVYNIAATFWLFTGVSIFVWFEMQLYGERKICVPVGL